MAEFNLDERIERMRMKHKQVESGLSNPEVFSNQKKFQELNREHQRLSRLIEAYDTVASNRAQIEENKELVSMESDEEMVAMIKEENVSLIEEIKNLEEEMQLLIVPPNPNDSRNSIIEIRPAAGGDESALFAEELMSLYLSYAKSRGWKSEVLEMTSSDLGGIKNVKFILKGEDVYREMAFESGVHRVQRVPATETQGRVHTSTVTVAVLPEADEMDEINIDMTDVKVDTYRASGAGGQHVNTTDSAVRMTHTPSGVVVYSSQERSQHKNRDICLRYLRSELLERQIREEHEKLAAERKGQVGTGDRSERIRTYNFPQNRCSDHRFGITLYSLPTIMQGDLKEMMKQILAIQAEERLSGEI